MHLSRPGGRWGVIAMGLILLARPVVACATPVQATDDTGRTITLTAPARRIVSLAPHVTELLFAAGAGDRVIAGVDYSDHPPAARSLPSVGSYTGVDVEAVLALEPDLVVGWRGGNRRGQLHQLEQLGLAVYRTDPDALTDIPAALRRLGQLAGTADQAEAAAHAFEAGMAELAARHRKARRVRVFYQVWDQPLMTVGGGHWIDQVITLCGGENVFAGLRTPTPTVSLEAVLASAPEVILAGGMGGKEPAWLARWQRWPALPAVRAGQLHAVDPDWLHRAGPRLLLGARAVCAALDQARADKPVR